MFQSSNGTSTMLPDVKAISAFPPAAVNRHSKSYGMIRAQLPPTPVETLVRARDLARSAGLRYAYIGNVPGLKDVETTFCPQCKRALIERDLFAITRFDLVGGQSYGGNHPDRDALGGHHRQ